MEDTGGHELVSLEFPIHVGNSLTLYRCGWENCLPKHSFGPTVRSYFLFHYIVQGEGTLFTSDGCYTLHTGQGFLIFPGEVTYYQADEREPWQYYWFGFDGYEAENILARCGLSVQNRIFTGRNGHNLEQALLELIRTFEDACCNDYAVIGRLYLVISNMAGDKKSDIPTGKRYAEATAEFIRSYYSKEIRIEEIAKNIGVDRSYLYKVFHRYYGCAPQQYLIRHRMEAACRLLESTDLSISEIAASCGFKDIPSFYRQFSKIYSKPPMQYRKAFQK